MTPRFKRFERAFIRRLSQNATSCNEAEVCGVSIRRTATASMSLATGNTFARQFKGAFRHGEAGIAASCGFPSGQKAAGLLQAPLGAACCFLSEPGKADVIPIDANENVANFFVMSRFQAEERLFCSALPAFWIFNV